MRGVLSGAGHDGVRASRARLTRVTLALAALALCAACAFASAPARAQSGYALRAQFGTAGSGEGQLSEPTALALSSTSGDLYVADTGNDRVEVFTSTGAYVSQFDGADTPIGSLSSPRAIALDNSTNPLDSSAGEVYVADSGHHVVDRFSAGGAYLGQLRETTGGVRFGEVFGVAVDPEGDLWVYEGEGNVDEFSDAGAFLQTFNTFRPGAPGFAVDSADDVYATCCGEAMVKFSSSGAELSEYELPKISAIAVDATTDSVFVDRGKLVEQLGAFGEPTFPSLASFPAEGLTESEGIAVDGASGAVYVSERGADRIEIFEEALLPDLVTGAVSGLTETSVTVEGTVNPAGRQVSACEVEYGTDTSYGQSAPCAQTPAQLGAGETPEPITAQLVGLQPDTTYHYRVSASNAEYGPNWGADSTFTTLGPLIVGASSVSNVATNSATLSAEIDPDGRSTTYRFEYGTSAAYGLGTPVTDLGNGHVNVRAPAQLGGLQPETTYHFRVVASNVDATIAGADRTFTTFPARFAGLPDSRVYELVSPAGSQSQNAYSPGSGVQSFGYQSHGPYQAALDGNAVAYVGGPSAGGRSEANEYLATRAPGGGWTAANIQPDGVEFGNYQGFSEDLSLGILDSAQTLSEAAPAGGYDVLYTRTNADRSYHPLFTDTPPDRGFGEFGALALEGGVVAEGSGGGVGSVLFAGSSADGSHMLFEANDALTANAVDGGEKANSLYESVAGGPRLVSILPDGTPVARATFGSPPLPVNHGGGGPFDPADFSHTISDDGSRIFWSTVNSAGGPAALFVRENGSRTIQIDASQGPGSSGDGMFWTASADGSRVFFTDCRRLTADSTAVPNGDCIAGRTPTGSDLYEYDLDDGRLSDLSVDHDPADTLGADVQGVVGTSRDGAYVYFVASGVLATGAESQYCPGETSTNRCNLYVRHAGVTRFIATLSAEDGRGAESPATYGNGAFGAWRPDPGSRTAEVSADGGELVLQSNLSLTGYPNNGRQEIYLYEDASGRLSCVSCATSTLPEEVRGSYLPVSFSAVRQLRVMTEVAGGVRVFFDSMDPLAAEDTNGLQDVYEWESDGAGSCRRSGGCQYLLSGGTSDEPSWLVDAGASGDDVFFMTRAQLVTQDQNENRDLYDARVGGAQPLSEAVCSGAGCQGVPPPPPTFATPASATFSGVGNFASTPAVKAKAKPKPKPKRKSHKSKPKPKHRSRSKQRATKATHRRGGHRKAGRS